MKVWQTLRTNYKVSDFVTWQRDGSLVLSPNFQRRPVWKKGAKSYLIDTILKGLPIPIMFLRERSANLKTFKSSREVVDGQQRIRTLLSYISPESLDDFIPARDDFRLSPTHNKQLGGRSFAELPADDQQQILDYQFSVHTFPADTDDREILQIFARMNSTGVKLNAQELRNAEYFGEFKTVILQLAAEQLSRWQKWHIFSPDNLARMDEVELSSELANVILYGIAARSETAINLPYKIYDDIFPDSERVQKRFQNIFDTIDNELSTVVTTLFNKRTLFYALFAAVYQLQYGLNTKLVGNIDPTKPILHSVKVKHLTPSAVERIRRSGKLIAERKAPETVLEATTRRTTNIKERRVLVDYLTKEE